MGKTVAWKIGDEMVKDEQIKNENQDQGKEAAADTNIKQEDEDIDLVK